MELVFEAAHQPLNRSIARSNNHLSHIFAVEQCVGNDWQGRLAALSREIESDEENKRWSAKRGIRRLLLGEQADMLDETKHSEFVTKCDEQLKSLFVPSLKKQFIGDTMISNFCISRASKWRARSKLRLEAFRGSSVTAATVARIATLSKRWIETLYPRMSRNDEGRDLSLQLFKIARRIRTSGSGSKVGKPYLHDAIKSYCAAVVQLGEDIGDRRIIVPTINGTPKRPFSFAVFGILSRHGEDPWAICFKCSKRGETLILYTSLDAEYFQLLQLSEIVRRVGLYHKCQVSRNETAECKIDFQRRKLIHTRFLLGEGTFSFRCRAHGYLPRMA